MQASAPALGRMLSAVPDRAEVVLRNMPLSGLPGSHNLKLQRFKVFTDDLQVYEGDKAIQWQPKTLYFKGRVQGKAGSRVLLSRYADERMRGFAFIDDRIWLLTSEPGGRLQSRIITQDELRALGPDPARLNLDDMRYPPAGSARTEAPQRVSGPAYAYTARVAVETDYEYYALFNNSTAALDYIGDLVAYASAVYETEVDTRLMVHWARLWTTGAASDPWSATTSSDILTEVRNYWNAWTAAPDRTIVHMLSGKNTNGGIAYVGVLCVPSYGYGVVGSINGGFNINNPSVVWDILAVAHEIGHNFNSPHTQDYCDIDGNPNPVDQCVPGCVGSGTGLPGIGSLSGGTPGAGNGTIMSYCHQLSPGYSNITMTFGRPDGVTEFAYGVAPGRIADRMKAHVQASAACLTPWYLLTVDTPVNGVVTGTGINCGADCQEDFEVNTQVTLTPVPNTGYRFAGWTGDCSGTGSCTVTMSEARAVGATFALLNTYELTASVTGNGRLIASGIDCGVDCSEFFTENTTVTLTAEPGVDTEVTHRLVQWGGDCSAVPNTQSTCSLLIDAAKNVTADFTHKLSVAKLGTGVGTVTGGNINCGATCAEAVAAGSNVSLVATPATGSVFVGWSGPCSGTGSCDFVLSGDTAVSAQFTPTWVLTVAASANGRIQSGDGLIDCGLDCSETYQDGAVVNLTPQANPGYEFSGWTGDCSGATVPCQLLMDQNHSAGANFVPLYPLTVTLAGAGSVAYNPVGADCGAGCREYADGTSVTLTAQADAGYRFVGWEGNTACAGAGVCVIVMNAAESVTARFLVENDLTVTRSGTGSGTVGSTDGLIDCGNACTASYVVTDTVRLQAEPDQGSEFLGWSGACSGLGACQLTMDQARTVNAEFGALYTLSVTAYGNGSISSNVGGIDCGNICMAEYSSGEQVVLSASPDPGETHKAWGGACAGVPVNTTCVLNMNSDLSVSAAFSMPFSLNVDLDSNNEADGLTDGVLVMRYLMDSRGNPLTINAIAPTCSRCAASDIEAYLASGVAGGYLDVDGSGSTTALNDGLLIVRYLLGLRGASMIQDAVEGNCDSICQGNIESTIQALIP